MSLSIKKIIEYKNLSDRLIHKYTNYLSPQNLIAAVVVIYWINRHRCETPLASTLQSGAFMNSQTVLRTESNGIEFFTVVATGESAVSEIGLSRMSGVDRQTMRRWFSDFAHEGTPKWLKPLQAMPLDFAHEIEKNGKTIKPIPAKIASKFLSLVAKNLKTDAALDSLDAIAEIGLTSYIQSKTGWLPEKFTAAPEAHKKLDSLLDLAKGWEECRIVVDEDGNERDMSESWTFLEEVVFAGFTLDEYLQYLVENRKLDIRSYGKYGDPEGFKIYSESGKIKLFFERNPEIEKRMQPYTENVERMLKEARTPQSFYRSYERTYGGSPTTLFENLINS